MSGDAGLFNLMHIEAVDPLWSQVAALNAFQPDALVPYPSAGALLAREQIAGLSLLRTTSGNVDMKSAKNRQSSELTEPLHRAIVR